MTDLSNRLNEIFASAYQAAALQEADMQTLAAALEPVRRDLKNAGDTLAAHAALDTAVGNNEDDRAEQLLLQLRADFVVVQKQIWVAEAEQALLKSPDEAWAFFLNRYAKALYYWRTQWMWWWADTAAGETPGNKQPWFGDKTGELHRFREQSRLIEHGRWPEAYPFLRELAADQHITPQSRAQIWTVCGSIQTHYNTLPDARRDLAEAETLFPDLPYLPVCKADLERVAGDFAASRAILEKHLAEYPYDPEAHISMGRSFMEENNLEEAGKWFDKSREVNPGYSSAYRNQMTLLGKDAEQFQKNKGKIAELRQLADRADPESALSNLLEEGYAYQSGGDYDAAAACFEKARESDPERLEPLIATGYLYQQRQQPEQATAWYEQVLRLAPAAVDGYWNLAALCAEQNRPLEAAAWYEKALPNCPMFSRTLLVKAGEMYIAAGEWEKARKTCLQALQIDPDFDFALNTLHDLSDKLRNKGYEDKTGVGPAIDLLRAIRNIKGQAYEATFQNRAGNVHYYFADYPAAAEHYRRAIDTDATLAVYHDNIAGTLEKISDASGSIEDLEAALGYARKATSIEPSNENYRHQVARFQRKHISLRHFGVQPDERSADIFSIRVRFRDELYPWFVKDDNLDPDLLARIEDMRGKFQKAFGITLPGVRFSSDWNIAEGANYVIDIDGIPVQQGVMNFSEGTPDSAFDFLLAMLEQNIQYNLADFIHYDSPEISSKFVGKSAAYASGFFQIIRMLLKQKISVAPIEVIHEVYEAGIREQKNIQSIARDIRCHPDMRPYLPVNTSPGRSLLHLTPALEEGVRSSVGKSAAGQSLWQIRAADQTFAGVLEYLPKNEFTLGVPGHFVTTLDPQIATLLGDLQPGVFFSQAEIINLTEKEKTEIPR